LLNRRVLAATARRPRASLWSVGLPSRWHLAPRLPPQSATEQEEDP